jgi:hypothetical protein
VVFFSIGFGIVATAWYFLNFFLLVLGQLRQRGIFCIFFYWFCNCCDSVVFFLLVFVLLRQLGIICIFSIYQAVATVPKPIEKNTKNTTLSQQFQNQ